LSLNLEPAFDAGVRVYSLSGAELEEVRLQASARKLELKLQQEMRELRMSIKLNLEAATEKETPKEKQSVPIVWSETPADIAEWFVGDFPNGHKRADRGGFWSSENTTVAAPQKVGRVLQAAAIMQGHFGNYKVVSKDLVTFGILRVATEADEKKLLSKKQLEALAASRLGEAAPTAK